MVKYDPNTTSAEQVGDGIAIYDSSMQKHFIEWRKKLMQHQPIAPTGFDCIFLTDTKIWRPSSCVANVFISQSIEHIYLASTELEDLALNGSFDFDYLTSRILTASWRTSKTAFRGVSHLLPGYEFQCRNGFTQDGNTPELDQSIVELIEDSMLPALSEHVYIEYSGGLESTILLNAAAEKIGIEKITAVHVSGESSNDSDDSERAENFAKMLGIKFCKFDAGVPSLLSIEVIDGWRPHFPHRALLNTAY